MEDRINKAIEYIENKIKLIPKNCETILEERYYNEMLCLLKGDKE